jgi:hypothetical protein
VAYDGIRRSISTAAVYNGLVFYSDFQIRALRGCKDGQLYWKHDMLAAIWVGDGDWRQVYIGDDDGDVVVLEASKPRR